MCLLDLSAAFDTVDHCILLDRFEKTFCFTGRTIEWLRTYLENRSFQVFFANQFSSPVVLKCGVPQGSIQGSLLFTTYTAELEDVVKRHDCRLHTYTDDNQVYLHCPHSDSMAAAAKLENCVEVNAWMASYHIKLNPSKTELM